MRRVWYHSHVLELIDRQPVIEVVKHGRWIDKDDPDVGDIEDAPPITPKTGQWSRDRLVSTYGGTYNVWRCSECQGTSNWKMDYCGYCGAIMANGSQAMFRGEGEEGDEE